MINFPYSRTRRVWVAPEDPEEKRNYRGRGGNENPGISDDSGGGLRLRTKTKRTAWQDPKTGLLYHAGGKRLLDREGGKRVSIKKDTEISGENMLWGGGGNVED